MEKTDPCYQAYTQILHEELVPAMGCTEPIALAYGAAKARSVLGGLPDRVEVLVSGNIIKNVKSVIVPNTGGLKGIGAAVAAGIVAGDETRQLQVLSRVTAEQKERIAAFLQGCPIDVKATKSGPTFDIGLTLFKGSGYVRLRIVDYHTNIVLVEKDGAILKKDELQDKDTDSGLTDRSCLNVKKILDYAATVELDCVRDILEEQIRYNMAISKEGLTHNWGACIGRVLLQSRDDSLNIRCRAAAAAGSDARMSGCEMPVVICSGSGNQGIAASVPVIVYAENKSHTHEETLRALVVSNLITIHQKSSIGRLSAFCGAVSAGCGAGAAIAWLETGDYDAVAHTLVNALAIVSGIICDGAKSSCAAKISTAVEAGLLGFEMYRNEKQFVNGDGIVANNVENTIRNVGRVGRDGMRETDQVILRIMTGR
ncbi:serine dehydratase subunit alpha family protein [Caproiciproducens sp. NJN-50]|nr:MULTISPECIES: L-serine ammonia-lyase, iron-sulfur-dependent, subunit alpha [Acutalibacteraceae]QAT48359.1 serine dehydratase subunit alpha family protein [Caproiciproducens sp. NJN-50]